MFLMIVILILIHYTRVTTLQIARMHLLRQKNAGIGYIFFGHVNKFSNCNLVMAVGVQTVWFKAKLTS